MSTARTFCIVGRGFKIRFQELIGCMELLAGPGILRTHLGRHGAGPEDCPRREAALVTGLGRFQIEVDG